MWVIFALLDPDPGSGSGSTGPIESGSGSETLDESLSFVFVSRQPKILKNCQSITYSSYGIKLFFILLDSPFISSLFLIFCAVTSMGAFFNTR